ncbi:MAG: YciI family protein [Solirubrobacteraceae bacterium]|jgi:hypothetical protein
MKYMVLINQDCASREWRSRPAAEQASIQAAWGEFVKAPGVTPGLYLEPPESATTVRIVDGETLITDGPYVETKEALDGFCMLEADDLDAAIEIAKTVPSLRAGGCVEIRPVVDWSQT